MKNGSPVYAHDCISRNPAIANARDYFEIHRGIINKLPYPEIDQIGEELWRAYEDRRKVFIFGNGGSASLAGHFACDLGKGTALPEAAQKRFQVISLTDNIALITAIANDISYEQLFAEQIRNLLEPGDVALAISASGNSPNVLVGLETSRELGGINIGLGGFEGGKMKQFCDLCAIIPSDNMQIIEDLHLGMSHALFTCLRQRILNHANVHVQVAEAS
jgi:D-sedoheptulose 7-phosphate isomerase